MNPDEVKAAQDVAEKALDAIEIKQLLWKPGQCRDIAIAIVVAMEKDRIKWQDEIDFRFVAPGDVNCIGMAWRKLIKLGVIKRLQANRRSIKKEAKGRTVWKYHLISPLRAKIFLEQNGRAVPEPLQPELLLGPVNP